MHSANAASNYAAALMYTHDIRLRCKKVVKRKKSGIISSLFSIAG